jgi:hypothetical protein
MAKLLAILAALAFGLAIMGISIVQLRGLNPGEESPQIGLVKPNSELSLYMANPGYFPIVVGQRLRVSATLDPTRKTEQLISLAELRFNLGVELIETGQTSLGLWTVRKGLIYQHRAIGLLGKVDESRQPLAEKIDQQINRFRQKLDSYQDNLTDASLTELNLLTVLLTNNTQSITGYLEAGE